MAQALNFLMSNSCGLQDKLQSWLLEYNMISCDENMNRCCETIEFTAKIQGELFSILNSIAAEGKHTDGVSAIKTHLLPCLGNCFSTLRSPVASIDATSSLSQELAEKDRKMLELASCNKWLESQLCATQRQLDLVKAELDDAHRDLDKAKSKTVTTMLATEDELLKLKEDLRFAHSQIDLYKNKQVPYHDYDRQASMLRNEVSYLNNNRLMRNSTINALSSHRRSSSPLRFEVVPRAQLTSSSSSRLLRVVSRFNDLYAAERKEAESQLQNYISNSDTVQRIIFIAVVESFKTAKLAYRLLKLRTRKTLAAIHPGPESLEDTILEYMVKNQDLHDVQSSADDVVSAMKLNPCIACISKVNFDLIRPLIIETCKLAFTMQTLDPPLDLAFASDGEHFIGDKYRRSRDSDVSVQRVSYHIWPAVMQGSTVRTKGEAVTKQEPLWSGSTDRSCGVSNMRSRSLSPTQNRSLMFQDRRSLSPGALSASCL
ncbi:mitochondria-eating protein [Nerophis lumbriciformis]|uniref:mitochondria-eating protein n=1 Tax=Nerophis lumbriciformis TaxID=546530 RepID=UPI002ADFC215|nr:mitochondria-eating protein [Nerophis lumbriciformis]